VASPIPQRVLVYDRISQNRTKTVFLVAIALLSIVPFLGAMGWGAYKALGYLFAYSEYQGPFARMQNVLDKLPNTPPEKLRKLDPDYERLFTAERRLFDDRGSGRISQETFKQEFEHLNQENERLSYEFERLVDPEGVQRREERQRSDKETRIWLTAALTLSVAAALGVLFWGLMKSPSMKALAFCGARPAGQSEAEIEAKRLLENLAIGAGLPPPKLYVINSVAPNAFAAGMDPGYSTVAVTTGLLRLLDRQELEGVLAHELAHIGNRDTRLSTTVFAITFFLRLPSLLWKGARDQREPRGLTGMRYGFGIERVALRLVGIPVFLYVMFVAPVLAMLIRAAISRGREALADADATLLTRYPEGLLRALAKIAGAGSVVDGSNPIVSHLYFADPSAVGIGVGVGIFSGNLLSSHPPIEERIARLLEFGATVPPSVIEEAQKAGETYGLDNLSLAQLAAPVKPPEDELTALANAETRSRVFRLLGAAPVTLYERDDPKSYVVAQLTPGTLLVGFEYRSKMRQVVTPNQAFGYISRAARLENVAMTPEEAFHAAMAPPVTAQPPLAVAAAVAAAQPTAAA
jgi:heat shock protein HtpX